MNEDFRTFEDAFRAQLLFKAVHGPTSEETLGVIKSLAAELERIIKETENANT